MSSTSGRTTGELVDDLDVRLGPHPSLPEPIDRLMVIRLFTDCKPAACPSSLERAIRHAKFSPVSVTAGAGNSSISSPPVTVLGRKVDYLCFECLDLSSGMVHFSRYSLPIHDQVIVGAIADLFLPSTMAIHFRNSLATPQVENSKSDKKSTRIAKRRGPDPLLAHLHAEKLLPRVSSRS